MLRAKGDALARSLALQDQWGSPNTEHAQIIILPTILHIFHMIEDLYFKLMLEAFDVPKYVSERMNGMLREFREQERSRDENYL